MLFFPGNEGTLSKFLAQMRPWLASGFDVFMFGYRGFGKSAFRWPTEHGVRLDALGAWTYLIRGRRLQPGQIIFYAQSLGCGVASWAAAECSPAALILEGGFPSVNDLASRAVPWLPVKWITTDRFDTATHLGRVACPVLVAHSTEDRQVPWAYGQRLLVAARSPKTFLSLRGEHARALENMPDEFMEAVISFLSSHAA
ncbi:MAG: alpha/beta fold hydrolase [candidate division FCPU426 bacterium]